MNYIGQNLKLLLKQKNINENELAKRIGIAQQVINRIISGVNQNPKISTILPIANYFNIPLHDLIESHLSDPPSSNADDLSIKIPYIDFRDIKNLGIDDAITCTKKFISLDIGNNKVHFATSMYDDSMEPKFPKGTILVFEKAKEAVSGDFCLIKGDNNHFVFRQVLINSLNKAFIKCLNPLEDNFTAIPLPVNFYVLATLLESRNIYYA